MSKYKQIIKNIYPTSPDGEMQVHNVAKLVHFCEISPQKILKVSKYIERKAKKDMSRSKIKFVGIALKIYQDLIKGCRKNLNLFAATVLNFIRTSLESIHPELKIQATETFIRFAEVLDESSQYPGLEVLVNHFFAMCQYEQGELRTKIRVREEGLRGIRAYMGILDMTDELDAFVTRHTDQENGPRFVPIILENVTYMAEAAANNPNRLSTTQNSVQLLATEVLRDVFTRANISVTSLFRAILGFLDSRNKWIPNTFAMLCFSAIYNCLKAQHEQILMTILLQHLDQNRPANIKKQVVHIMLEFFREATGHFMQILDTLTRHLVSSVEIVSQDQRARDYEDHIELQETIVHGVGSMCQKVTSQNQVMEAFNFLCEKLCYSKHIKPTGLAGAAMAVAQCILQVTNSLKVAVVDPDWISYTSVNLLKDMTVHPHYEVRIIVHKICHSLLLGGKTLAAYFNDRVTTNPDVHDKLLVLVGEVVRDTLLEQIKIKQNQPENYTVIFQTLSVMLRLGNRKDFYISFPTVFALQKSAAKWKKVPQPCGNTINTVIAAYLYAAADLFNCPPLSAYVDGIIEKRKKAGQLCPYTEIVKKSAFGHVTLILLKDKYTGEMKRKIPVEYVLFDREHTSELLCTTPSCVLINEPRLKKLLAKKIHRNTRTLLRDATVEFGPLSPPNANTVIGSPPPPTTTTEAGISHILISSGEVVVKGGEGEKHLDTSGGVLSSSDTAVVFKPNSIEEEKKRKRITFDEILKEHTGLQVTGSGPIVLEVPEFFTESTKKPPPFEVAANNCYTQGQHSAHTLLVASKIMEFDSAVGKKFAFKNNNSSSKTIPPIDTTNEVADGAGFLPEGSGNNNNGDAIIITPPLTPKVAYIPPTSTLFMNFNSNGLFLIV